jgi:hypothetical protein
MRFNDHIEHRVTCQAIARASRDLIFRVVTFS